MKEKNNEGSIILCYMNLQESPITPCQINLLLNGHLTDGAVGVGKNYDATSNSIS